MQRTISIHSTKQKFKVKCIAMDSNETMFVTGSADGDIKVHTKSKNFVKVEYL